MLRCLRRRELTGKGVIRAPSLALEHAPCLIVRIVRASRRLLCGPRRHRYKSLKWLTDEVTAAIINLAFASLTPRDAKTCPLVLSGQARGIDFGKLGWVTPTMLPISLLRKPPVEVTHATYWVASWQRVDGYVQQLVVTADMLATRYQDGMDIYGPFPADEWSMSEGDTESEMSMIDSDEALSNSAMTERSSSR